VVLASAAGALPLPVSAIGLGALALGVAALAIPRVALVLLIFSIPFSSYTKVSLGPIDVTATDVLLGILMVAWLIPALAARRLELRVGPTIVASLCLLIAMLVSSVMTLDFPSAAEEMIKVAEVAAIALYAACHVRTPGDVRFLVLTLLAAGATEAFVGLFQSVSRQGPESFALGGFIRAYGDFSQPNAFAGYLAMILPLGVTMALLPGRERPLIIAATLLIGAGVAASLSRGALLGVAVALALIALLWSPASRRVLAMTLAAGIAVTTFSVVGVVPRDVTERVAVLFENFLTFNAAAIELTPANFALVHRLAHWQAAWAMFQANPLLGVGPGNFDTAYQLYHVPRWPLSLGHAHNYYLNTLAELGIIGFAALIAFLVTVFRRIGQAVKWSPPGPTVFRAASLGALGAAVTLSAHNAFDNMLIHGIGVQFGLILGMVEGIAFTMDEDRANRD
jgi:O-antigen ligase